jgi:hypothetical protein
LTVRGHKVFVCFGENWRGQQIQSRLYDLSVGELGIHRDYFAVLELVPDGMLLEPLINLPDSFISGLRSPSPSTGVRIFIYN